MAFSQVDFDCPAKRTCKGLRIHNFNLRSDVFGWPVNVPVERPQHLTSGQYHRSYGHNPDFCTGARSHAKCRALQIRSKTRSTHRPFSFGFEVDTLRNSDWPQIIPCQTTRTSTQDWQSRSQQGSQIDGFRGLWKHQKTFRTGQFQPSLEGLCFPEGKCGPVHGLGAHSIGFHPGRDL